MKHPVSGKVLDLRAPLPKDFQTQIKRLKAAARRTKPEARPAGVPQATPARVLAATQAPHQSAPADGADRRPPKS